MEESLQCPESDPHAAGLEAPIHVVLLNAGQDLYLSNDNQEIRSMLPIGLNVSFRCRRKNEPSRCTTDHQIGPAKDQSQLRLHDTTHALLTAAQFRVCIVAVHCLQIPSSIVPHCSFSSAS